MKNTEDMLKEPSVSDCLMKIMPFLVWSADMGDVQGGVNADEALESFRYLLGWDEDRFEKLCDVFRAEVE